MKIFSPCTALALMACFCFNLSSSPLDAAEVTKAQQAQISKASGEMAAVAKRFLASLTEEQRKQATFKLDDKERTNWHFIPDFAIKPAAVRNGLPMTKMTPQQRIFAVTLPSTALSHRGYLEMMSIRALEQVLFELEGKDYRNPELYYVSIFGKPDAKGTWGWRFEGHHLSVNLTIVDGKKFSVTPSFFGSNPATVKQGPLKGVEVLKQEQQLALNLVKSFNPDQLAIATIDTSGLDKKLLAKSVLKEVLTTDDPVVDKGLVEHKGIEYADLDPKQQKQLLRLVNVYLQRFRPELLKGTRYLGNLRDGDHLYFAWSGGQKRGEFHYYRIQSKVFLIEFANTQNDANHVHAVWREFDGDFGRDLLKEHFKNHHQK
ncbi:hypothetical protein Pan241w_41940 [Gimesia alba]|uniref:DUF3500 domain-containing protein n=1 Tax=Gimesia alba TaxID=2527973 RepID=A0A517RJP6_9PLAN|nr:DUF3500 domain-containing protein [Gimesia alba]QDT44088.1 hypothetical protein Pan241w_41940 [Gimesia alba]